MTARCKDCSSYLDFRATKGAKLKDRRCTCGGCYEIMSHADMVDITGVKYPDNAVFGIWNTEEGRIYAYPYKNRVGDRFILDRTTRFFLPLKTAADNEKPSN